MAKGETQPKAVAVAITAALVLGFGLGYVSAPRPDPVVPSAASASTEVTRPVPQSPPPVPNLGSPTTVITARTFQVLRIIDGDTFVVPYDGEETSVRIFGINAPERRDRDGPAATEQLTRLIQGRQVTLEFPTSRKRDDFGRLLARVYVDGEDVGEAMLRLGSAKPYRP